MGRGVLYYPLDILTLLRLCNVVPAKVFLAGKHYTVALLAGVGTAMAHRVVYNTTHLSMNIEIPFCGLLGILGHNDGLLSFVFVLQPGKAVSTNLWVIRYI